jgi:hypothetical protein
MEPHGRGRRPKAMDHKFLAAYAAAYTYKGKVIPHSIYKEFTSDRGERLWKSQVRKACDLEWRDGESRDFDEIRPAEFTRMVDFVSQRWHKLTDCFDGRWIVKWALRSTWTNRRKNTRRAEQSQSIYATQVILH